MLLFLDDVPFFKIRQFFSDDAPGGAASFAFHQIRYLGDVLRWSFEEDSDDVLGDGVFEVREDDVWGQAAMV